MGRVILPIDKRVKAQRLSLQFKAVTFNNGNNQRQGGLYCELVYEAEVD